MPKYVEAIENKLFGLLYDDGSIVYTRKWNESISGRTRHKCNIHDKVNEFPCTDQDFIILKAKTVLMN